MRTANIFNISSNKTNFGFSGYRSWLKAPQIIGLALLLSACGGGSSGIPVTQQTTGSSSSTLKALPDTATTTQNTTINIPVLSNDTGVSDGAFTLAINQQPANGTVSINSNKTIKYSPKNNFSGTDTFSYKITKNSVIAITSVTITISCPTCTPDITLSLRWQPSSLANDIGYLVYFGTSASNVNSLAYDLTSSTGLNPSAPSVDLSAKNDLHLNIGDQVCFRIQAYNDQAVSNLSSAVCGVL